MSIHVTDFKWEKGKNDVRYIELLEKTLKNEQVITANAIAKIRALSAENKGIRAKAIDEFVNALLNYQSQDEEYKSLSDVCYEIAEQLKGGAE